jgi:PDDEXK-like domain of unknown function (DUF3799)
VGEVKTIDGAARVTTPGLYRMPAAMYHSDPVVEPSLSNSIARLLVTQSPRHAFMAHPRLNPRFNGNDCPDRTMQIGSVAHAVFLGAGANIKSLPFDCYRSEASKKARDAALEAGQLPILAPDMEAAVAMVEVARREFSQYPEIAPVLAEHGGLSEVVAVWRDGPTWCRAMMDRVSADLRVVLDYKTTQNAHPAACARRIFGNDYQIQAPWYVRGLDALDPDGRGRRHFYFLYQEQSEPYACSVHELDGHAWARGEAQVEAALLAWAGCRARNEWPGYPRLIHRVELPPWADREWEAEAEQDCQGERPRVGHASDAFV